MVLVDTSVWVSHLRGSHPRMISLLNDGGVVCHPFIIGELSGGNLTNMSEILSLLHSLPMVNQAEHEEVLQFVESNDLMGRGSVMLMYICLPRLFYPGFRCGLSTRNFGQLPQSWVCVRVD